MQISTIPRDNLLQIFSFLFPEDLCIISSVCKIWNNVAADDRLWEKFGAPKWRFNRKKPWKKLYIEYFRNGNVILRKRELNATNEIRFSILFAQFGTKTAPELWKLLLQRDVSGLSSRNKGKEFGVPSAVQQLMVFRGREVKFYFKETFLDGYDQTTLYEFHACLLLYSVSSKETFDAIVQSKLEYLTYRIKKGLGVVLVGVNLNDKEEKKVSSKDVEGFAKKIGIPHIEITLSNEENVTECFEMMLEEVFGKEVNYMPSGAVIQKMSPRGYVPPPSHIDRTLYPGSKEYDRKYRKKKRCC